MQLSIVYSYCMSSKGTEVIYFKPSHQHLVSFPDPTTHVRKGSGDIGADSWFCKLSNHVIFLHTCRFVLEHVRSRDGAQDQENASMSPDPFLLGGVRGSGTDGHMT